MWIILKPNLPTNYEEISTTSINGWSTEEQSIYDLSPDSPILMTKREEKNLSISNS